MVAVAIVIASFLPSASAEGPCKGKKHPEFEDHPAGEAYQGSVHPPILSTPLDNRFRTAIKDGVAKGVNFAGHYIIVTWGCGIGCQSFVIVDAKTGKVYDPAFAEVGYHFPVPGLKVDWWCYSDLLNFRKDSNLLVVQGCLQGKQCGRTYFVIDAGLKQIDYDPDLLPDGKIAPQ
jgi:hypothetical protein